MANESSVMTAQEAIAKAEQELSTSRYIAECTRSPGMRAIHDKRCAWLSVIVELAKKAVKGNAVEVVHGRWIFKHNPITDPKKYFIRIVCSECNLHTGQKSNYCPNCGAKMDGGDEDG